MRGLRLLWLLFYITYTSALEVDLLDSFGLKDGENGVALSNSLQVDYGFYFSKTTRHLIAENSVMSEVVDLLKLYPSFIVKFKIRPVPYHKGSLVWIEQKNTASSFFGIWMRSSTKSTKFGLQFVGKDGVQYVTLEDKMPYDDPMWRDVVIHFHKSKNGGLVDLYVDCTKQHSKKALPDFNQMADENLELRLAQREIAGKIFSRYKGSLSDFRVIFGRNISTYIAPQRCSSTKRRSFSPSEKIVTRVPRKHQAGKPVTNKVAATQNDLENLANKVEQAAETALDQELIKEILNTVKDVKSAQTNQVFELKSLREVINIIGLQQQGSAMFKAGNITHGAYFRGSYNGTGASKGVCDPSPCYPFVLCHPNGNTFVCGACPIGMEGNGVRCSDINECEEKPCSSVSYCENKSPGYICHKCPDGYRGEEVVGIGRSFARIKKQECVDVDECTDGTHDCDKNGKCINTPGSFRCGECNRGYRKDRHGTCLPFEVCNTKAGSSPCSMYATCVNSPTGSYCKCRPATAGDGYECGDDSDGDGYPDDQLKCESCKKDNCPFVPNSGQEDYDGDGKGDACDSDIDNDRVYNSLDNCPYTPNKDQTNSDLDEFGDACDNCPFVTNHDQLNTDGDKYGDVCDKDIDDDGVINFVDNCVNVANADQLDRDKDGTGDVCDNCPDKFNSKQENKDGDAYGDECDNDIDNDNDGHIDVQDNCPDVANSNQLDTDNDGKGDLCDNDDDNDGVADILDNCEYVYNPGQQDTNKNGVGDACEKDIDGDGVENDYDACPSNRLISKTDYRHHDVVLFGEINKDSQKPPHWIVINKGREVRQTKNAAPSAILSREFYNGFDMSGSMFVNTQSDDDFVGLVFGYQNDRHFYVLSWKQRSQSYWLSRPDFLSNAKTGIELKYVHSNTGKGFDLRAALWHTGNVTGQTTEVWSDKEQRGWEDKVPYQWKLIHRPAMGLIRLVVHRYSAVMADSGYIFHDKIKGGRVGPYAFSQSELIWSNINIQCNENIPDDIAVAMKSARL